MTKIKRILCPTDLTVESDGALRYATALASTYKARLILFYCREPGSIVDWATASGAARRFQQALFGLMDANELKSFDWKADVAEADDIGKGIVEEATKQSADLIVMQSRRRPHAAALLGSTAETVSQSAPCPVLVTHPTEREWVGLSAGDVDLRRVLVAHNFSPNSELALSFGLALAQQFHAEVHLLHVVSHEEEEEPEVTWSHVGLQSLSQTTAHRLQQTVSKEALLWCNLVTAVREGKSTHKILNYAREHEIDLICVGASRAGLRLTNLIGSTVDYVLRGAPCPVLVARLASTASQSAKAA